MSRTCVRYLCILATLSAAVASPLGQAAQAPAAPGLTSLGPAKAITEAECVATRVGESIPQSAIGLPVAAVRLQTPRWTQSSGNSPARCEVDGAIVAVDPAAPNINFRVVLPTEWNRRAVQQGGGGMNGTIPNLLMSQHTIGGQTPHQLGFVTYGSDSGHQSAPAGGRRGGGPGGPAALPAPPAPAPGAPVAPGPTGPMGPTGPAAPGAASQTNAWSLNDEAVKNLGFMQMKKTRDAAMVVIERVYGERPRYTYYLGTSQGGREALTVAQRYPADYDGVISDVPIVNFSSLMLAPELIRIHEKPIANWVTLAKVNAIRGEFMRQCDGLDQAVDGVINNYMGCRALFDVTQGQPGRRPWATKRCPNSVDPDPDRRDRQRVPDRRTDLDPRVRVHAATTSRHHSPTMCGRSACGCRTRTRPAAA